MKNLFCKALFGVAEAQKNPAGLRVFSHKAKAFYGLGRPLHILSRRKFRHDIHNILGQDTRNCGAADMADSCDSEGTQSLLKRLFHRRVLRVPVVIMLDQKDGEQLPEFLRAHIRHLPLHIRLVSQTVSKKRRNACLPASFRR